MSVTLPRSVVVKRLLERRYISGQRPSLWQDRRDGIDTIESISGETINLISEGSQSSPKEGWSIVLIAGDSKKGFQWTLFSLGQSE